MKKNENKTKVKVHPSTIKLLTDATWNFAYSMIWQNVPFSQEEIELAKSYIREYYLRIPAKRFEKLALFYFKSYRAYIRLAKKYNARLPQPYLASPALWLNRTRTDCFCSTKAKHLHMLRKRCKTCSLKNCKQLHPSNPSDFISQHKTNNMNTTANSGKSFIALRPYTVKELCQLYGVSRITFRKWLNKFIGELGSPTGRYFSIPQVRIIFKHLDLPAIIEVETDKIDK